MSCAIRPSLLLCLFRQTSANVWELFAFVDGVFNQLRLVCPAVAVRAKHRVIRRHIAVFFLGEFVELERVFVVCLRLQFQESLGGVFNERFIRFVAVVRETVFVIAVDFVSVCPSVLIGRTPQIDAVRTWRTTRCWEKGQCVFAIFSGKNGRSRELDARVAILIAVI